MRTTPPVGHALSPDKVWRVHTFVMARDGLWEQARPSDGTSPLNDMCLAGQQLAETGLLVRADFG